MIINYSFTSKTQSLSASSKMRLLFSLLSSKSMTCFSICFIRWMRSSLVGRLGPMRQFLGSSDYLPSISLRLKVSLKLIKNNYISLNLLRSFSVSESIRLPGKGTSLSTAPNSTHWFNMRNLHNSYRLILQQSDVKLFTDALEQIQVNLQ